MTLLSSYDIPQVTSKTSVSAFSVTPDGSRITVATDDDNTECTVWVLETSSPEIDVFPLRSHTRVICSLAVEDHLLFSGAHDKIVLWDLNTRKLLRTFDYPPATAYALMIWDAGTLISSHYDKLIRVWDRDTGTCRRELVGHEYAHGVRVLARWKDKLVSAGENVRLWDTETGEQLRFLEMEASSVSSVAVHGDLVAASSKDKLTRVWNLETGELLATLSKHTFPIGHVQMNTKHIVTGAADSSVGLWDTESFQLRHFYDGPDPSYARCTPLGCMGGITRLDLNDNTLLIAGWEGVARIATLVDPGWEMIDVGKDNFGIRGALLQDGNAYLALLRAGRLSVEVWNVKKADLGESCGDCELAVLSFKRIRVA